jgi:hypothetical protein
MAVAMVMAAPSLFSVAAWLLRALGAHGLEAVFHVCEGGIILA